MEYLGGMDLKQLLRERKALKLSECLDIALQVTAFPTCTPEASSTGTSSPATSGFSKGARSRSPGSGLPVSRALK
jgi:hypothetical protein